MQRACQVYVFDAETCAQAVSKLLLGCWLCSSPPPAQDVQNTYPCQIQSLAQDVSTVLLGAPAVQPATIRIQPAECPSLTKPTLNAKPLCRTSAIVLLGAPAVQLATTRRKPAERPSSDQANPKP